MIGSIRGSVAVTLICVVGCAVLKLLVPASIGSMTRLALLSVPLVLLWYGALRLTRHELVEEVHHLATGLKVRLLRFV
jgi:hypothetical protein